MIASNKKFYFVGIAGVGMSAVAYLLKKAGHKVVGSDQALYPPSSVLLAENSIPVKIGYKPEHIRPEEADIFVVGNALSKTNPEVQSILDQGLTYMSFPQVIHNFLLQGKVPVVVCGTHGKTTTSSWITQSLYALERRVHSFIGGVSIAEEERNPSAEEKLFVLEGDEYDTAFFDKGSKFLHYAPKYLILNNIEFDHADIFKDLEAIYQTFEKLLRLVDSPQSIIANVDDPGVCELLKRMSLEDKVYQVSCLAQNKKSDMRLLSTRIDSVDCSTLTVEEKTLGTFEFKVCLSGDHNTSNALQCLGFLFHLKKKGELEGYSYKEIAQSLKFFTGVQKRLEKLGTFQEALIYRDFAHHPTAVEHILKTMKKLYPKSRLVAGFEPKNASSRRNVFLERYKKAFSQADQVFFMPPAVDQRIAEDERMDIYRLQEEISKDKAHVFSGKEEIKKWCGKELKAGDVCIFLSCGDFLGIPLELV